MSTDTLEPVMAGSEEGGKSLAVHGLEPSGDVFWNLAPVRLYEESFARGDGQLVHMGAISAVTAPHTGRSPNDRFVVRDENTEEPVDWGKVNVPVSGEHYATLRRDVVEFLNARDLFVQDCYAGADPDYRLKVRVVTESAWHNLFARNMFRQPTAEEMSSFTPELTILNAPYYKTHAERDGVNSDCAIMMNFRERMVLVAGTQYAGTRLVNSAYGRGRGYSRQCFS